MTEGIQLNLLSLSRGRGFESLKLNDHDHDSLSSCDELNSIYSIFLIVCVCGGGWKHCNLLM